MANSEPQIETRNQYKVTARSVASPSWLGVAHAVFFCTSRLAFGTFLLLTSVYCLLVWVPFSYTGFILNPLLSWIPVFVRLHGLICVVLLGAIAVTLVPDLRREKTRRTAAAFLLLNGSVSVYLCCANALAGIQPDIISYSFSIFSLFPLLWLAALDLSGKQNRPLCDQRNSLNLAKTTLAAVMISVAFAATSALRGALQGNARSGYFLLLGFAVSLCFHLIVFTALALILNFVQWATRFTPWPEILDSVLTHIFAGLVFFQMLRTMILPTISFEGTQADIFAAAFSFVLVFFAAGVAARLRALAPDKWPSMAQAEVPAWIWVLAAFCLFAAAYGIPSLLGPTDWDFVLQRTAVVVLWLLVLQMLCWTGIRIHGRATPVTLFVVLTMAGAGFVSYAKGTLYSSDPASMGTLEIYAGTDISFKTMFDLLSRPIDNKAHQQFYEFLKQNTNLGRNAAIGPSDVRLVSDLQPTPGIKPNIFVFVIDSLRQDYVPVYNPAVDYMPQIERFARDSVVMENAYTRYGGTALSEPAIWVGAMQLHTQFIAPYYPMNNLQKLLETDGYQSYVSVDPILRSILRMSSSITELDKDNKYWAGLDFIPTLQELEAKIDSRPDRTMPIFAYTQPQNVHTMTTQRSKMGGRREELRRIDAAFGNFVEFLRQRGLYENSIIILTADHGDSNGEFGRYGHSVFLFPEIVRIPLIIHLPPRMRQKFVWDAHQLAFNTDITPSLYYLLGHRPVLNNELFGRPLFTQTLQEQSAYLRAQYLIVSSYAPVYAILAGSGQSLFIVDAVNSKNYYYNLVEDPRGTRNHITFQLRDKNEAIIRHQVGLIDDLYGWHPTLGGQFPN